MLGFGPLGGVPLGIGPGGSVYAAAIAETASAADVVTAGSATYNLAVVEAATATSTQSSAAVLVGPIVEAMSAVDTVSPGGSTYAIAVAETATAASAQNSTNVINAAITDATASATDLYATGSAVYPVTVSEAAHAADHVTAGSTMVNPGPGNLGVSGGTPDVTQTPLPSFNWRATVISQYQTSPTILQLIESLAGYLDPAADFDAFYDLVWNVNTAVGWGLDVWGRIVGVSRVLHVSVGTESFGWEEGGTTDYTGFGQAPFFGGGAVTSNFALSDPNYRILIFAKAAANITDGSIPAINKILQSLFPGRGNVYVTDGLNMSMTYTFAFAITSVERAIVAQSGALPKPVGVSVTVVTPP